MQPVWRLPDIGGGAVRVGEVGLPLGLSVHQEDDGLGRRRGVGIMGSI